MGLADHSGLGRRLRVASANSKETQSARYWFFVTFDIPSKVGFVRSSTTIRDTNISWTVQLHCSRVSLLIRSGCATLCACNA